jgi:hypothetical protein
VSADLDARAIAAWRLDPVAFVVDNFNVQPDPWQVDALRAFANPAIQRISLQACAGPGKSAVLAWCLLNFLACYGDAGDHPNGAAVSITQQNLRDNLWKELAKWHGRSPYLSSRFTWTAERIFANAHPSTWFLSARTWPKTASPDEQGKTLSGLHGRFVMAVVDESGAIPTTVQRAAEQALATGPQFGKIMQAGNTLTLDGMLYAAASSLRDQWFVVRVTGDPDDPKAWVHSPRVGPEPAKWAATQIAAYGRDNPWVMAYILGLFPPASINALLGVDEVEEAMARHLAPDAFEWAQKRLGVDVARYGDDRTVIFPRQGMAAFQPIVLRHGRGSAVSVDIATRVMNAKVKWGAEAEFFDATGGWAAGAVDVLRAQGYTPIDVQFAAPSYDNRYANRRAEIWFSMAEWVKRGAALPPMPELLKELITPTYTFKNGKLLLEDKDLIKKRIGTSPDLADALALTFGMPEMPGGLGARAVGHALTEFDPFRPPQDSDQSGVGHAITEFDPNER